MGRQQQPIEVILGPTENRSTSPSQPSRESATQRPTRPESDLRAAHHQHYDSCCWSPRGGALLTSPRRSPRRKMMLNRSFSFTALKKAPLLLGTIPLGEAGRSTSPPPANEISSPIRMPVSRHRRSPTVLVTPTSSTTQSFRRTATASSKSPTNLAVPEGQNAGQFLAETCPSDVLPLIMMWAGPETLAALGCVNRRFQQITTQHELTWKTLCEGYGKWSHQTAVEPKSWKEYYHQNPCVPVDFRSIPAAITATQRFPNTRVLVRPGSYPITEPILLPLNNNCDRRIVIERTAHSQAAVTQHSLSQPVISACHSSASSSSLWYGSYQSLSCTDLFEDSSSSQTSLFSFSCGGGGMTSSSDLDYTHDDVVLFASFPRNQSNQPLFRLEQSSESVVTTTTTLTLRNLSLHHDSLGMDIWGGNSAIQVEGPNYQISLDGCEITSKSGRGIVVSEGATLECENCHIHSCAATGLYVGGCITSSTGDIISTRATLSRTDITTNGLGNPRVCGGIGRGHSGIYLEHGALNLLDCNVSLNAASGLSVILSMDETEILDVTRQRAVSTVEPSLERLRIQNCDIVGNGVQPIDWSPSNGVVTMTNVGVWEAEQESTFTSTTTTLPSSRTTNHERMAPRRHAGNRMLPHGSYRPRSTLLAEAPRQVISCMESFDEFV